MKRRARIPARFKRLRGTMRLSEKPGLRIFDRMKPDKSRLPLSLKPRSPYIRIAIFTLLIAAFSRVRVLSPAAKPYATFEFR